MRAAEALPICTMQPFVSLMVGGVVRDLNSGHQRWCPKFARQNIPLSSGGLSSLHRYAVRMR